MNFIDWTLGMIKSSQRILRISKYPSKKQFLDVIKATGISIIIIGAIGVAIKLLMLLTGVVGF